MGFFIGKGIVPYIMAISNYNSGKVSVDVYKRQPHNLREVVDAVVKLIDNRVNEDRDTDMEEVLQIITCLLYTSRCV